jgi:hypothetical protein
VLFSHILLQGVDAGRGASSLTLAEGFCIRRDRFYISIAQYMLKSSFLLCTLVLPGVSGIAPPLLVEGIDHTARKQTDLP